MARPPTDATAAATEHGGLGGTGPPASIITVATEHGGLPITSVEGDWVVVTAAPPPERFVVPDDENAGAGGLGCFQCQTVATSTCALRRHELVAHLGTFKCQGCNTKSFECSADLRRHSRIKGHEISASFDQRHRAGAT